MSVLSDLSILKECAQLLPTAMVNDTVKNVCAEEFTGSWGRVSEGRK